jgi:predicted acylesterase/phospholipase RssA
VFCHWTTPRVLVADAVIASSAIPAAFPSARAIFPSADGIWAQRMVDGGAWANFPRFVFHDPSFAAWIEQTCAADLSAQRGRPTVGFTLGEHEGQPLHPHAVTLDRRGAPEYDRGTLQDSGNPLASPGRWLSLPRFSCCSPRGGRSRAQSRGCGWRRSTTGRGRCRCWRWRSRRS